MSCILTQGNNIGCGEFASPGGVKAIYLANNDDVTSITESVPGAGLDTILMDAGKTFFKYDFSKSSASFTQTYSADNNSNTQVLTFGLPTYSQALREIYEEIAFASIIAIVELRNNVRVILGYGANTSGLEAQTIETASGAALTDLNVTTFTLQAYGGVAEILSNTTVIPV